MAKKSKKPTRPKPPKREPARAMAAKRLPENYESVRVRMYRQGFGDCFLLTFPRLGKAFHMLIDCGVLAGTPEAVVVMKKVAADIHATTGGRLDLLIVSHPAWDCVSGFIQARSIFDKIDIDQVWLAWSEDPHDPAASKLKNTLVAHSGSKTEEAMEYIRRKGRRVRFWRGGEGPVALPGVTGVRIFVLGPPRSEIIARAASAKEAETKESDVAPFDQRYQISFREARAHTAFAEYFNGEVAKWRRIGEESPGLRAKFALRGPEHRNDTSLALAIELLGPRGDSKVLLFPGDAQLQSWMAWHELRWPWDGNLRDPKTVTVQKLLERTVLYKVAHHGSTLGTPMQWGLDMMVSPELVAMLPVDEMMAKSRRWELPAPAVLSALRERTGDRVLRADFGDGTRSASGSTRVKGVTAESSGRHKITALYIEHLVAIPKLNPLDRRKTAESWSAANERRLYLIDKRMTGAIRPEEEAELRELETLMDEYLSTTAPSGLHLLAQLRQDLEDARARD